MHSKSSPGATNQRPHISFSLNALPCLLVNPASSPPLAISRRLLLLSITSHRRSFVSQLSQLLTPLPCLSASCPSRRLPETKARDRWSENVSYDASLFRSGQLVPAQRGFRRLSEVMKKQETVTGGTFLQHALTHPEIKVGPL